MDGERQIAGLHDRWAKLKPRIAKIEIIPEKVKAMITNKIASIT